MEPEHDLIDRVARDMTDAEPGGDFRVRVISKLPSARPRQNYWHYLAIAGAGVAAGMVIMFSVNRFGPAHRAATNPPSVTSVISATSGRSTVATPINSVGSPPSVGRTRPLVPQGPTGVFLTPEGPFPLVVISPLERPELSIAPIVLPPVRK